MLPLPWPEIPRNPLSGNLTFSSYAVSSPGSKPWCQLLPSSCSHPDVALLCRQGTGAPHLYLLPPAASPSPRDGLGDLTQPPRPAPRLGHPTCLFPACSSFRAPAPHGSGPNPRLSKGPSEHPRRQDYCPASLIKSVKV